MDNDIKHVIDNINYAKPNFLISAKYRSSIMVNKIIAASLLHLQKAEDSTDDILVSKMKAGELKKMFNASDDTNFYKKLKKAAQDLTGQNMGILDPETGDFCYLAVVTVAAYQDGVFAIEYNRHLTKHLQYLKNKFTILNLPIMLSLENEYAFRLYELLKSISFPAKNEPQDTTTFQKTFKLSELRFLLGAANVEIPAVKKILDRAAYPDYDAAWEKTPDKLYEKWYDFRRWVLDIAVNEINEKSDIRVEYSTIGAGYGGKVERVVFQIDTDPNNKKKTTDKKADEKNELKELTEDEKIDFIDKVLDIMPFRIKFRDLQTIIEASNYDLSKIQKAIDIANKTTDIQNLTGFLLTAIKENWDENISLSKASAWAAKERSQYGDLETLEQQLLNESHID